MTLHTTVLQSRPDAAQSGHRAGGRRTAALLLCLMALFSLLTPLTAHARSTGRTVRVGWYESPYNITDRHGRRSGYAYEYQRKIAAYTGWDYEYVEGTWPELMEMLENGELDLMSDVSYTPERAEQMLYADRPMGTQDYYLFIDKSNREISPEDFTTLNGKRVGANKGSVQIGIFRQWAESQGIRPEIVELTCTMQESLQMLRSGEIDVYLALDSYGDPDHSVPICMVGSSDFYFAVNREREDLLDEMNQALDRINDENRFYNQQLYEKYSMTSSANLSLTKAEQSWLERHGPIRVGYQDDYMAFCAADENGELTGALKDYLALASKSLTGAQLRFDTIAYPTKAAVLTALENGEIDCMFPANLTDSDAENLHAIITPAVTTTEVYAVVRQAEQQSFVIKQDLRAAVDQNNTIFDMFLSDHFPQMRVAYYPDTPTCLRAVADESVDCLMISNYRYNSIRGLCDRLHLTTVPTGVDLSYGFAIREGSAELYAILNRVSRLVPESSVNAALNYYSTEDTKVGFADFVKDNLAEVIALTAVVAALFLALILRSMREKLRAEAGEKLISSMELDELTGLYHRNFFFEYAGQMQRANPKERMDAVVVNIEQFHTINELQGRELGDQVLRTVGEELRAFLRQTKGIGCRFDGDRFEVYCAPQQSYQALLDRLQTRVRLLYPNASIRLRMGVAPWQEGVEPTRLFDRARTATSTVRNTEKHLLIYDEQMREREDLSHRLLNDYERALRDHEFQVYYQPKYDIQSEPPRFSSAEALIRWQHPELGLLQPGTFIPLFESNGLVSEIDKYVWRETVQQIVRWRESCGVTVPVSVNLSRVDALDPALEQRLDDLLDEYGLDHRYLHLEVTETACTDDADQLSRVIGRLRSRGYLIEMDDFGSGYSSLNMLSTVLIDVLKMDMAFVRNIEHSEKDLRLVELILEIARNLKVPVVAEGVETENQMRLLRQMGCALVQGYYFSRPLPSAEFERTILRKQDGDGKR